MNGWLFRRTGLRNRDRLNVLFRRFVTSNGSDRTLVVADNPRDLLRLARTHYGVPECPDLDSTVAWLAALGATQVGPGVEPWHHYDEHVDQALVVADLTIYDPELIATRGTAQDRWLVSSNTETDGEFDPLEFGLEQREQTIFDHELGTSRLLITLEQSRDAPETVGNFTIAGPGQWLREALWAGSGVVPRDSGGGDSELYGDAFVLAGRARFESDPIPGWRPRS